MSARADRGPDDDGRIPPETTDPDADRRRRLERLAAAIEVALCSGFPTQLVIASTMAAAGWASVGSDGRISTSYLLFLTVADTVAVVGLVLVFFRARAERASIELGGGRSVVRESLIGVPLAFGVSVAAATILVLIRSVAPSLHNVARNPLEEMLQTVPDALALGLAAVVGGAIREEVQRAFILRRFEQHLGGGWVGLAVFSVVFGAGHTLQGWDVAITTAVLSGIWGATFLVRRSMVAPAVSHALFNLTEVFRYTLYRL